MTYCLGWKLKSGILLAADSAATWLHEPPPRTYPLDVTSVGERHGVIETRKGPKYVFEEALKIRQIGDSIAAITGDMDTAANLLRTIETAHAAGLSARAALDAALTSNRPFSEALGVSVLYAFYEAGVPHLVQLDTDDGGRIHEIEDLAQIGSIPEAHKRYTRQIIASLREHHPPARTQPGQPHHLRCHGAGWHRLPPEQQHRFLRRPHEPTPRRKFSCQRDPS